MLQINGSKSDKIPIKENEPTFSYRVSATRKHGQVNFKLMHLLPGHVCNKYGHDVDEAYPA